MRWKGFLHLGLGVGAAVISTCNLAAQTPTLPTLQPTPPPTINTTPNAQSPPGSKEAAAPEVLGAPVAAESAVSPYTGHSFGNWLGGCRDGRCIDDGKGSLGPTPFPAVSILQDWIYGKDNKDACLKVGGWMDFDYTYRSTGSGPAFNPSGGPLGIAPVMNHFGNEFLVRQLGLMVSKPLDTQKLSWGFNIIAIAGSDAYFLQPTKGWYTQTDPRFGFDFTDLNLTAHLPILTEGGVDVKVGRQTTILGPMGALAWQRPLNSSDYAWYNLEEGRYTGISSIWHVNKQLNWYNGLEWGWGTFFAQKGPAPQYITNVSYWLDHDAKDTKVWTTVLTGPTTDGTYANTTVFEFGILKNWNRQLYTIVDTQMVHSRGPVFGGPPPPNYIQRAYDVYTYNGIHLDKCWDLTSRLEYYYDADGRNYAGGFGTPKTSYYEVTFGVNYHPTKWAEFRPEIRYDGATNAVFGSAANALHNNQLTISADLLLKF